MKTPVECERARLELMPALDGEHGLRPSADSGHVATCESCQDWVRAMNALDGRLQGLTYPPARVDLWRAVEEGIVMGRRRVPAIEHLWPIGVALLGWRALQLFVDLPLAWLHPVVPMTAVVLVAWRLSGDLLTIEVTAPELQKRGV